MINANRIAQLAKKWQRATKLRRKHLSWGITKESDECCASVAGKGHCVVYTADGRRFEVPLVYLGKNVFKELLWMSQEECGDTKAFSNHTNLILCFFQYVRSENFSFSRLVPKQRSPTPPSI
jgi:hypothetical protein